MKKLFVPFELSLLLKERGFNEPCFAKYSLGLEEDNYKELQFHIDYSQENDKGQFIPIENNFMAKTLKNSDHPYVPSAPLYQQAIDWFDLNHSCLIYYIPILSPQPRQYGFAIWYRGDYTHLGIFNTIEEGYNNGIYKALEIIR
jgi:hypothetical protein